MARTYVMMSAALNPVRFSKGHQRPACRKLTTFNGSECPRIGDAGLAALATGCPK
jgi:hypothetical protein